MIVAGENKKSWIVTYEVPLEPAGMEFPTEAQMSRSKVPPSKVCHHAVQRSAGIGRVVSFPCQVILPFTGGIPMTAQYLGQ
jgi:hypothetical protein